ncbi:MAG TPA: hypothetical protein VJ953_20005 [Saprospiraceae bacterium]|nr:hypothetical protein [Saprospiraceae bacterium]
MRKFTFLLLFLAIACQDSPEKSMIAGDWKYDMAATLEELKQQGADQNMLNFTQSIMIGLQGATLKLESSGTAVFAISDMSATGKWQLQNKGTEFHLQLDSIEQVSEVLYLSADTLILTPLSEENQGSLRVLTRP